MFKATDQGKTLERLRKAMQRQHPVTISYVKADGEKTLRTIEIFEIPEELTKGGKQILRAMDRNGNARTWRLDRIVEFTVHRSRYVVPRCTEHNVHPDECFSQGKHDKMCPQHDMVEFECYGMAHGLTTEEAYIHYVLA